MIVQGAILRLCTISLRAAALLPASRFARLHHATPGLHVSSDNVNESEAEHWDGVSNMLVCGDGDLSYSACLAPQLAEAGVSLTATVLEDKETHHIGVLSQWLVFVERVELFSLYLVAYARFEQR
jgi:hypothetical protein